MYRNAVNRSVMVVIVDRVMHETGDQPASDDRHVKSHPCVNSGACVVTWLPRSERFASQANSRGNSGQSLLRSGQTGDAVTVCRRRPDRRCR